MCIQSIDVFFVDWFILHCIAIVVFSLLLLSSLTMIAAILDCSLVLAYLLTFHFVLSCLGWLSYNTILEYNTIVLIVFFILFWSGHCICVGNETKDEEKRKIIQIYVYQRAHIAYYTPTSWINRPSGQSSFASSI